MSYEHEHQQNQKQQEKRQQRNLVSHLNNDIFNNGLKFERDRTFRNKLIMKAILIMAFLLIAVAVLCATATKTLVNTTVYNETKLIKYYKKVAVNYDEDSEKPGTEREVLQQLKTTFIPPEMSYRNLQKPQQKKREKRHEEMSTTGSATMNSLNVKFNPSIDVIWLSSSESQRKKHENIENNENVTNAKSDKEENGDERAKENNKKIDKVIFNDRYEDISMFWKKEMDKQSIRTIQAEKMLSYMDLKMDPCEDFYQYACGNWENINPIPKDKAAFDTFEMLRESLHSILRDLLLEPSVNDTSEAVQKAKDFFESCMNEDTLMMRGNEPLYTLSKKLKHWPMIAPDWNSSNFDWIELMAELKLYSNDILVSHWVGPDIRSSADYIIQFDQASLGLPTRDYYLQASNEVYLEAYKTYMIQVAVLLGADRRNATVEAEDVIDFETKLARITASLEERRNVTELYTKMSLSRLSTLIPEIDWVRYLTISHARKIEMTENVVVFAIKYLKDLPKLIRETPPRIIANYLMWRFMKHRVNSLGKEFQDAKQDFYFVLFGREKAPERWTICVSQVNSNMGMALGSMFVQRYFDESSKNDTLRMTYDIMNSFKEILNATEWIGAQTKNLAQDKVNAMILRIGYPDFILNTNELNDLYRNVNISKNLYFENTLNLIRHHSRVEIERLGTKVNKTQWNTPPAVVNAYYSRNKNQILFPAGILQPPFYHKYFPRSLNYGGIGIVIGHEITHGFDDRGRLFDQHGNLDRWWDEEAIEKFHQKAKCLIDQYSAYTVRDIDIQIDGVHTQGENIADNGGIKQAYKAYEKWLSQNNATDETLPGLNATNIQLFFLNFAQVWCGGIRPEASRNKLKTAVHSPGKFRVIGTLSNSEEFAAAFNCSPNSTMNLANKCKVW